MSKMDDLLRQACGELAEEEEEKLESSLTFEEIRKAEALYRDHQDTALKLIRGRAGRHPWKKILSYTAAAALVGAVYLALGRAPLDRVPAAQPPTASVAPYYSSVPTFSPVPTEKPTITPTETPEPMKIQTETPTLSPTFTPEPTATPTAEPTAEPTATLTPEPTEEPTPETTPDLEEIQEAEEPAAAPEGWTGLFFPQALPEGSVLSYVSQDNGRHIAAYTVGGKEILITEYDAAQAVALDSGAEARYVQLGDGVALRSDTDVGVTVTWVQDGHTLSVACEEADAEAIARSVRRVR